MTGDAVNQTTTMGLETAPEALLRLLAAAMDKVQRKRIKPSKPGKPHRV